MAFRTRIENTILPFVAKPNRYIGNFVKTRSDRLTSASLRAIVVHPEVFEAGLADRDTRSAYAVLNSIPGVVADLAFLPWPDMAALLDERRLPLWGLETFTPVGDFDLVLFTPSSVLHYVPMLRILALSGIPLLRSEREAASPIVAALGAPMGNPAPLASFLDVALIGEPEAVLPRAVAAWIETRGRAREEKVAAIATLPGTVSFSDCGPGRPVRAQVSALGRAEPLDPGLLPLIEAGHEGLNIDIRRGGTPLRFESGWRAFATAWEMPVEDVVDRAERELAQTGFDRIDLTGDHPWKHGRLLFLAESLMRRHPGLRVVLSDFGVSEPSPALARELLRGRRTAFGWSPLAGSPRLRRVLNHDFDEDAFLEAVGTALRGGGHMVRLRFGIGWPTETDDDLKAIGDLVRRVRALKVGGSVPRIQVQLQPFVPRPHTPLQWEAQIGPEELARRIDVIRDDLEHGPVQVRVSPPELPLIEALLARGGSEMGPALRLAMRKGAMPPNVSETWNPVPWLDAMNEGGVAIAEAIAGRALDAVLPWSGIDAVLPREVLLEERSRALAAETTTGATLEPAAAALLDEVIPPRAPEARATVGAAPGADAAFGRSSRRKAPGAPRQASRFRVLFSKGEEVRFTAHLDVARAFERTLRRLAAAPGPLRGRSFKLSFGPPLPLGMTSDEEYLDITFSDEVPETALGTLQDFLPPGFGIRGMRPIRASVESLCQAIDTAVYHVRFPEEVVAIVTPEGDAAFRARLDRAVSRALALPEILVPKSADDEINRIDARSTLLEAHVVDETGGGTALRLHLAIGAPGNQRPEALIPALTGGGFDARLARIHRLSLRISGAGKEFSPLEVVELDFPWWRETLRKRAAGQRP